MTCYGDQSLTLLNLREHVKRHVEPEELVDRRLSIKQLAGKLRNCINFSMPCQTCHKTKLLINFQQLFDIFLTFLSTGQSARSKRDGAEERTWHVTAPPETVLAL